MTAVISEFLHIAILEPFKGLKAICGFTLLQRLKSEMIQADTKTETLIDIFQDVEGGKALEILASISLQHIIIEPLDVEANNEIRSAQ